MEEVIVMSIEISAKIKKAVFSVNVIKKSLSDFFNSSAKVYQIGESSYKFTQFCENDDIILFFRYYNNDYHYWDSLILKAEYSYCQSLVFDVSKFSDVANNFKIVFEFLLELQKTYNSDILITSNIHDEICYINIDSKAIWSNNCNYVKDLIKCSDLIFYTDNETN